MHDPQGQLSTEEAKQAQQEAEKLNAQAQVALETAQKEEAEAVKAEVIHRKSTQHQQEFPTRFTHELSSHRPSQTRRAPKPRPPKRLTSENEPRQMQLRRKRAANDKKQTRQMKLHAKPKPPSQPLVPVETARR